METLFRFLDWRYSRIGALITGTGLTEELYSQTKLDPDLYAQYGITSAFWEDEDGMIQRAVPTGDDLCRALAAGRLACMLQVTVNVNKGLSRVTTSALELWKKYEATGYIFDYVALMDEDQSALYAKIQNYVTDYMAQAVPEMIKNGLGDWDTYAKKIGKFGMNKVTAEFQEILDSVK